MEKHKELIKEIIIVLIASLFLGLLLSIKISWPILSLEPTKFGLMFLLSLLMLAVFVLSEKIMAEKLDCNIKIKFLTFKRYWFQAIGEKKAELPFDFPAWLVLPLILLPLTTIMKIFPWLAILDFDIEPKPSRVRKRWQELTEADVGKIAIAGPIAVLILGLIVRIAGFNEFAMICSWLAFLTLIPIGQGFKIMNSIRISWFFSLVFSLFIILLTILTNNLATIIIALLLAAIITIIYYTTFEK